MEPSATEILELAALSVTECRKQMIDYLLRAGRTMTQEELSKKLSQFDRATLYRNYLSLEEKGIIHRIEDGSGQTKYGICLDDCNKQGHSHHHFHLYCIQCQHTYCVGLESETLPLFPSSVAIEEFDIIAKGLCARCKA